MQHVGLACNLQSDTSSVDHNPVVQVESSSSPSSQALAAGAVLSQHSAKAPQRLEVELFTPVEPGQKTKRKRGRGNWTPDDDAVLSSTVKLFEGKRWKDIAQHAFHGKGSFDRTHKE